MPPSPRVAVETKSLRSIASPSIIHLLGRQAQSRNDGALTGIIGPYENGLPAELDIEPRKTFKV